MNVDEDETKEKKEGKIQVDRWNSMEKFDIKRERKKKHGYTDEWEMNEREGKTQVGEWESMEELKKEEKKKLDGWETMWKYV